MLIAIICLFESIAIKVSNRQFCRICKEEYRVSSYIDNWKVFTPSTLRSAIYSSNQERKVKLSVLLLIIHAKNRKTMFCPSVRLSCIYRGIKPKITFIQYDGVLVMPRLENISQN